MKKSHLLMAALAFMMFAPTAFAQDAASASDFKGLIGLGAGLAVGLGSFGAALGQGSAAKAALEGIARNPSASDKLFTPMLLGLALMESLAIYGLVMGVLLWTKI
ncbi:MAG: ATP synthase F0 subunit C [Myxococcota bacterium]